jgi:hypothetical protein
MLGTHPHRVRQDGRPSWHLEAVPGDPMQDMEHVGGAAHAEWRRPRLPGSGRVPGGWAGPRRRALSQPSGRSLSEARSQLAPGPARQVSSRRSAANSSKRRQRSRSIGRRCRSLPPSMRGRSKIGCGPRSDTSGQRSVTRARWLPRPTTSQGLPYPANELKSPRSRAEPRSAGSRQGSPHPSSRPSRSIGRRSPSADRAAREIPLAWQRRHLSDPLDDRADPTRSPP